MEVTEWLESGAPLPPLPPDLPDEVQQLVTTATAIDPSQRFASALELRGAIVEIQGRHYQPVWQQQLASFLEQCVGVAVRERHAMVARALGHALP